METIKSQKNFGKEEEESQGNNSLGRLFVIYKSKTSHLNYDFRLEMEDPETGKKVFISWAVPKNLPTIPEEKHLAIRIEDHRVEQLVADNENVQGKFSEGDIEIWDKGKWGLMKGSLASGRLSFNLFGEKLKGRYQMVLVKDFGKKEVDDGKIKKDVNWLIWKREVGVFF
jgi:bifunctional non-homologous end joining protein LigD